MSSWHGFIRAAVCNDKLHKGPHVVVIPRGQCSFRKGPQKEPRRVSKGLGLWEQRRDSKSSRTPSRSSFSELHRYITSFKRTDYLAPRRVSLWLQDSILIPQVTEPPCSETWQGGVATP